MNPAKCQRPNVNNEKKANHSVFSLGWNFKYNQSILKSKKEIRKEEKKLSEIVKNTLRKSYHTANFPGTVPWQQVPQLKHSPVINTLA